MRLKIQLVGLATVAACSPVNPDYVAPEIVLPASFVGSDSSALVNAAEVSWWQRLNDPLLNQLIARGAAQNLDVAIAVERIRAADAALGRTGLNSQLDGTINATAQRRLDDGEVDNVGQVSADARYVLDLFGGVQRSQEQALANFEAAQLDAGTARLAFLAELTNAYVNARFFQNSAAITRETIQTRRRTLGIVSERSELGQGTALEVQQARAQLASAEASLPVQVSNFEVSVFRIATLLAEPAGPILDRMERGAPQPRPSGITTVGLPADLLRNRPDVRAAERNYAAAAAAVGVSEAALYPSVSLLGTVGTGAGDNWSFGPTISIPVFNRGFLQANRAVAESQARAAELAWRNAVLVAMEEVQAALTLCRGWYNQLQAAQRAANASGRLVSLSREAFANEAGTLDDILDAQRQHAANQLAVADALRNYTLAWQRLQLATGQGWRVNLTAPEVGPPVTPSDDPVGLEPEPTLVSGN